MAQPASPHADGPDARDREIRIALVLYGGVSLAVYEHGVTRCFFDLVKNRGVFRVVRDLLHATATVDVVAGTSAGGINGLFLAAALESGADFAPAAALWRELGDLGDLLRDIEGAPQARSLLDGERTYQHRLIEAFTAACTPPADQTWESPGEMDVFVTATDLDGHERCYRDGLGTQIVEKDHRVVFHLQHRPTRKALGLPHAKPAANPREQGTVLGTLARITSSFPVAFPPFRIDDVETFRDTVAKTLDGASGIPGISTHNLVDGGLLANKPFGPVLRAIFHRMPAGLVERRLFYVEPDPESPVRTAPAGASPSSGWGGHGRRAARAAGTVGLAEHSPMTVAMASATVPSHQSISADIEQLRQHNERITWLRGVRQRVSTGATAPPSAAYVEARLESVARSLALPGDDVASVETLPPDEARERLLAALRARLRDIVGTGAAPSLGAIDPFDVAYHLRRTFQLLYRLCDELDRAPTAALRTAVRGLARIVKAYRVVHDRMIGVRDVAVPAGLERITRHAGDADAEAQRLLATLQEFLDQAGPHWQVLVQDARVATGGSGLRPGLFPSDHLTEVAAAARRRLEQCPWLTDARTPVPTPGNGSVLAVLARAVDAVVAQAAVPLPVGFDAIDRELYSAAFAGGVYELDRIRFVRISPLDATVGLAVGSTSGRLAGDQLAHFSAFLRRDWRGNDILQGRLDGCCQIVRGLLDDESLARILSDAPVAALSLDGLAAALPLCPRARLRAVVEAWERLRAAHEAPGPTPAAHAAAVASRADEFREALIAAGQVDVFEEEFPALLFDVRYQELAFRRRPPRSGDTTARDGIASEARLQAEADVASCGKTFEARWKRYEDMAFGSQPIVGPGGRVPRAVVGEYATRAYLHLWGMVRGSANGRAGAMLDGQIVRLLFRSPLFVINRAIVHRDRLAGAVAAGMVLATAAAAAVGAMVVRRALGWPSPLTMALFGLLVLLVIAGAVVFWRQRAATVLRREEEERGGPPPPDDSPPADAGGAAFVRAQRT